MFSVVIDPSGPVAVVRLEGHVDGEELVEAAFAMRERMGEKQEMPQLWDARRVTSVTIAPDVLESFYEIAATRVEHRLPMSGRRAVVANDATYLDVGEALADVLAPFEVELRGFSDVDEAMAWLRRA